MHAHADKNTQTYLNTQITFPVVAYDMARILHFIKTALQITDSNN